MQGVQNLLCNDIPPFCKCITIIIVTCIARKLLHIKQIYTLYILLRLLVDNVVIITTFISDTISATATATATATIAVVNTSVIV